MMQEPEKNDTDFFFGVKKVQIIHGYRVSDGVSRPSINQVWYLNEIESVVRAERAFVSLSGCFPTFSYMAPM